MATSRTWAAMLIVTAAVLAGGPVVARADKPADKPPQPDKPAWATLYLPVYSSLALPHIRAEVGLSDDQLQKLRDISQSFQKAAWKQQPQIDWTKLTEEERKKKTDELRQEYERWTADFRKRTEEARQQIEAVLTPQQTARLQEIDLRLYAGPMLLYGAVADKLTLTDQQKERLARQKDTLQKKLADLQQQMQQTQDQANRAALEMLTPEQRDQLKKLRQEGFRGVASPAAPPAAPKK